MTLDEPVRPTDPGPGLGIREPLSEPDAHDPSVDYEVGLESLSQWQIAWRKFKRHRLAMVGLLILGFLVIGAIIIPIFLPFDAQTVPFPDEIVPVGRPPSLFWQPPSTVAVFGETGGLQRDVWQLVWNGARTSLFVGFSSMFIGVFLGTIVGTIAGFFGGLADNLLMRVVDIMLSLPLLFVILVASRFFGNGSAMLIVLIFGLFSWMGVSRLVRSLFLSLREQDFVEAARAVGVVGAAHRVPAHPAQRGQPDRGGRQPDRGRQHHRGGVRELPGLRHQLADADLGQRAHQRADVHPARATGGGRSSPASSSS